MRNETARTIQQENGSANVIRAGVTSNDDIHRMVKVSDR